MKRIRRALCTTGLVLFGLGAWADGMTVFVNGVKYPDIPMQVAAQTVYPLDTLSKALGVSFSMTANGALLNGLPLKSPPLLVGGRAYTTLDVATRTVGGTMVTDPVRAVVQITCNAKPGGGFAYYDANYKTPAQQELDEADRKAAAEGHPMKASSDKTYAKAMKENEDKMPSSLKTNLPDIDLPETPLPSMSPTSNSLELPKAPSTDPNSYMLKETKPNLAVNGVSAPIQLNYYQIRTSENGTFKLTVRDVKIAEVLKGLDPPAEPSPGNKFIIIYITEENLTKGYQSPAWFAIHDATGASYDPDRNLSEFSLASMRGHESTVGFLVCQMPVAALPSSIEVLCNPSISLSLGP